MNTPQPAPASAKSASNIAPKEGVKTSSFYVFMATLLVGAVFSYLARRGLTSPDAQGFINQHKDTVIGYVAEAMAQSIPYAYFALVAFLGRVYMKIRERVSMAKADALRLSVQGAPGIEYRALLLKIKDIDTVLPILSKVTSVSDIEPTEHLAALTRLAQEVGRNRREICVILLALQQAGILRMTPEEIGDIHITAP